MNANEKSAESRKLFLRPSGANGRRPRFVFVLSCLAVVIGLGISFWLYEFLPRKIASSGGYYFFSKLVLHVPRFAQADPKWGEAQLGPSDSSLGAEGCAVSSAAMVLAYYGVDVDPGRLNEYLTTHAGYTDQGWLYWEKAADFAPGVARHAYEDLPSYQLIDSNIQHGNPVIVRIRLPSGATHFVVIAGKEGFDYLIQDPASRGVGGLYPLRDLAHQIDALRFYEPLHPSISRIQ